MSGVSQCPAPVTGGRSRVSSPLSRTRYRPLPSPSGGRKRRRARLGPLTQPYTPPHQKDCKCCWAMAAAGNIEALWGIKHHQSVELSVQGKAERGHGDWGLATHCPMGGWGLELGNPLSLFAPELLDCHRCGNGCEGGFVWDAFITVLNNSEYPVSLGGCGVGGCSRAESAPGFVCLQAAWPAKRTTHTRGMSEPASAGPRSIKRWPGSRISSCCRTAR